MAVPNDNKVINIVFVADKGYICPTAVAVESLVCNRNEKYHYDIFILTPEGDERTFRKIERFYKRTEEVDIRIIPVSTEDLKGLHTYDNKKYLAATEAALIKFKIPEILPDISKAIYLDGDIIVRDDLVDLYNTDLEGKSLAAVLDLPQVIYEEQEIGYEISGRNYFNTGVMLMNLAKLRVKRASRDLIETKKKEIDSILMDQNVFNRVFRNDILDLHFLYNTCYINLVYSESRYDLDVINSKYDTEYSCIQDVKNDIKIMHFSSKLKPWLFYDVPLADEWLRYYKTSVFSKVQLFRTWHTSRDIDAKTIRKEIAVKSNAVERDKKIIPICYCADSEYLLYAAASIKSVIDHKSDEYFYDINILVDECVPEYLRSSIQALSDNGVSVRIRDIRNCFDDTLLYSVGHYSRQMYYRWFIPEVCSEYDKVLYLDSDVILREDVAKLFETDIGDNYIGAANNFVRTHLKNYIRNHLGLSLRKYYNSGVILINTSEFIENNLKDKLLSFIAHDEQLACPDQDALNVVCKGHIYEFEDVWNFQWHHQFADIVKGEFTCDYTERYKKLLEGNPKIIHYTSEVKPWNSPDRSFAGEFWKYCKDSGFYEAILLKQINNKVDARIDERIASCGEEESDNSEDIIEGKNKEIVHLNKTIDELQYYLDETRKSKTYKIGRVVTAIPREIREVMENKNKFKRRLRRFLGI